MTQALAGPIIFDSSDILKSFKEFNSAYNTLLDTEDIPPQLTIQRVTFNTPRGLVLAALFAWSGYDLEEGKRWSKKIASFGPAKMNMVALTTIPEWISGAGAHVPEKAYGSAWTHNVSRITPSIAEAIGRNLPHLPADPGAMFSLHQLRGPSAAAQQHKSVFSVREPHYMLEILGYAISPEKKAESEAWAVQMATDVEQAAAETLLPTSYVSLFSSARVNNTSEWVERVYGDKSASLREIKATFDPDNMFKFTVPSFEKGT